MNRLLYAALFWLLTHCCLSQADEPAKVLDERQFAEELNRLAQICDQLGLQQRASVCRRWLPLDRQDQRRLYLPFSSMFERISPANTPAKRSWEKHFSDARQQHADYLFSQLQGLAEQDEATAFRQLWRVLKENPEHVQAQALAGNLLTSLQSRPRISRGRQPIAELQWPPGSYREITTTHFQVFSKADVAKSIEIARNLEQFYVLWAQVFYELWAPPGILKPGVSAGSQSWPTHDRLRVVLLDDREAYVKLLGGSESQIGISVGYYNPKMKMSFFYPADELRATLFHELSHQLMMEATRMDAQPSAGLVSGIWLIEGIALYMESLTDRGPFWSLGGWECPRMQTARYRAVRDGYWPDWQSFTKASAKEWQHDVAVAQLYTHAAGLTHTFLDRQSDESRAAYLQQLVSVYQGNNQSATLLQYLGQDQEQAKANYQDQMLVDDQDIQQLVESAQQPRDLVLSGSRLSKQSWQSLSQFHSLDWLNLAFTNARDMDLVWLQQMHSLQRISVEGCDISKATIERIASLPSLKELDLSNCPIADSDLEPLRNNATIETIWLSDTKLTNQAIAVLQTIGQLGTCDVRGSEIGGPAWEKFLQRHPNLQP